MIACPKDGTNATDSTLLRILKKTNINTLEEKLPYQKYTQQVRKGCKKV